jgi:CRISPR-associated protein Csd1
MLLQRLVEYSRRPDVAIAPTMYSPESLRYWIELDGDGAYRGLITVESETGKRPPRVEIPTLVRSSAVRAKLLADNAEYVLGVGRSDSKRSRVDACHNAFVTLVRDCSEATRAPSVSAVLHFLEELDVSALTLPADFDPAAFGQSTARRERSSNAWCADGAGPR